MIARSSGKQLKEKLLLFSLGKCASLQTSLQSTRDTISCLKKELHVSNFRLGWFGHKLKEVEHKFKKAKLKALRLQWKVDGPYANAVDLIIEVEF